jgi:hypothetical protein
MRLVNEPVGLSRVVPGPSTMEGPPLEVLTLVAIAAIGAMALVAELYLGGRRARRRL